MPEGDTIAKAAARLRAVLAGHAVVRFEAPRLRGERPRPGTAIEGVEAQGKHLLVHFAGGLSLRTHLRMTGSWQVHRAGERWRKPAHLARVVVEADSGWVAVCFSAPVVETYRRGTAPPAALAALGPDLCRPGADGDDVLDAVLARVAATVAATPGAPVADVLLDQRVAAGIGNVYKSEVCFACRVDPATPAARVDAETWRHLFRTATRLLRANLDTPRRATWGPSVAVYRRRGRPCPRCATPIRTARLGEHARSTYWCPTCQPPPGRSLPPPGTVPGLS